MRNYQERLKEGVLLFDGAIGTMLYSKGIFLNRCFEEVCLSQPDLVAEIHREYVQAGAQALTTNSYGANRFKLNEYQLADQTEAINRKAAELARKEAGEEIYVAGSIGPIGKRLKPLGDLDRKEAAEAFQQQAKALEAGGVDLILLETFHNRDELTLAVEAISAVSHLPIQAQFSLGREPSEERTAVAAEHIAALSRIPAVTAVGVNCTVGPAEMLEILPKLIEKAAKPLAVMPNAGYPKEVDGRQLYLASPDYFSEYATKFLVGGAAIIGGCCGTTPEHIHKMAQLILNFDTDHSVIQLQAVAEDLDVQEEMPLERRSRMGAQLARGEWITTVELVSPANTDLTRTLEKCEELYKNGIDLINIPDGPRASSRISALVTAMEIERKTKIETILHLCTRDINLIGLQSLLLGAQSAGLRNLLLITGDPPKVGKYPDVTGVFDLDSTGLISLATRLNRGINMAGESIATPTSFVKGAGLNPVSPFPEKELEKAFRKAEEGTEFFITQPSYDPENLSRFLEKIAPTGVPVLLGVWPLASYRNALFLNNEVPGVTIPEEILTRMSKHTEKEEARKDGVRIAREMINALRPKIAGIQVSPPFGNLQTVVDVTAKEFE